MITLVVDSSLSQSNLALQVHDEVYLAQVDSATQQAEQLVNRIDALVEGAGIHYSDIQRVMSVVGPGSFTGIRIGLAAVRALLLAHTAIEACNLSSLQAIAYSVLKAGKICSGESLTVLNKAGKGELYVQRFQLEESKGALQFSEISTPMLAKPNDVPCQPEDKIAGNGVELLPDALKAVVHDMQINHINAAALLTVGVSKLLMGAPEPLYIRAPDAVKSVKITQ